MTEKWAQECARYEQEGASEYLKAALQYEKQSEDGWSQADIADEVTGAGFPIHRSTVTRRLAALKVARLTRARVNSKAFLEAFAEAYADENAAGRGQGMHLDPETARRVFLEGAVHEFQRHFSEPWELDEEELANVRLLRDNCDAVLAGRPILTLVENAG